MSDIGGLGMTVVFEVLHRHSPPTIKVVEVLLKQLRVLLHGVTTKDASTTSPVRVRACTPDGVNYTAESVATEFSTFPEGRTFRIRWVYMYLCTH